MKAKEIRKGKVLMYNDAPHSVMDFQHRTPGNLRAFVQVKLRNLVSGVQSETRFSSTEDISEADVYTCDGTYLYKDGTGYHFMNSETYEENRAAGRPGRRSGSLLSGRDDGDHQLLRRAADSVSIPKTVVLTIVETEPEMRGSTASNSPKPALTDTGLRLAVPPFLEIGDQIAVDTEEGVYLGRAEK